MIRQLSARTSKNRRVDIMSNLTEYNKPFLSNSITTAKYNFFTFLPKFLFEQFRRYPNLFFLTISILQQLHDPLTGEGISPTGKFNTVLPLIMVLSFTAMIAIYEDYQRHNEDRKENESNTQVFSRAVSYTHLTLPTNREV